jgi:hypothetical protein
MMRRHQKIFINDGGSVYNSEQFGRKCGRNPRLVRDRLANGWTADRISSTPADALLSIAHGKDGCKVTKSDLERLWNESPLQALPGNIQKLIKRSRYSGTRYGHCLRQFSTRDRYRVRLIPPIALTMRRAFNKFFEETYLPHQLSLCSSSNKSKTTSTTSS